MFEFEKIDSREIQGTLIGDVFQSLHSQALQAYTENSNTLFADIFNQIQDLIENNNVIAMYLKSTKAISQLRCYMYYHKAQKLISIYDTKNLYISDDQNQQFFASFYETYAGATATSPSAIAKAEEYFQDQRLKISLLGLIVTELKQAYDLVASLSNEEAQALKAIYGKYLSQLSDAHFDCAAAMHNEHLRSAISKEQFKPLKRDNWPLINKLNHYFISAYQNLFSNNNANNYNPNEEILNHYHNARILMDEAYKVYYHQAPSEEKETTYGRICFSLYKECQTTFKMNLLAEHIEEFTANVETLSDKIALLPDPQHIAIYKQRIAGYRTVLAPASMDLETPAENANSSLVYQK